MDLSLVPMKNIPRREFKKCSSISRTAEKKERCNRKSRSSQNCIGCSECDTDFNTQYAYNEWKFVPSHQVMALLSSVSHWSRSKM